MKRCQGVGATFFLRITKHVQGDAVVDMLFGAHAINCLLHLEATRGPCELAQFCPRQAGEAAPRNHPLWESPVSVVPADQGGDSPPNNWAAGVASLGVRRGKIADGRILAIGNGHG